MNIRILAVPGCPHLQLAVDRVHEALRLVGRSDVVVNSALVADSLDGGPAGFAGSPTILIDGRDPFAEGSRPAAPACRIYRTPDGPDGVPSVQQLGEAITAAGRA